MNKGCHGISWEAMEIFGFRWADVVGSGGVEQDFVVCLVLDWQQLEITTA
jgi:hypothetical protein